MARIMDLRRFIHFYYGFVQTSAALAEVIPPQEKTNLSGQQQSLLAYNYSDQRPLVNEIMLSRAVESFDLYLTTVLRDIFRARPEVLKSEGTIEVAAIIDAGNYDALIWQIVERKVHDLAYKPLSELRKFIHTRTGVDLFDTSEAFELTILVSEIRNLIAHNDCIINDHFKRRTMSVRMLVDVSETGRVKIEDDWLRDACYQLDDIVFRFDERVAKKFDLRSLNRMTSFILRS
ncbi:hypothetical protein CO659_22115 [Rhizobium sp. S9]|nr:hypothetical protein CO659_22115 [Rhizobium sp. S9]